MIFYRTLVILYITYNLSSGNTGYTEWIEIP